MRITWIALAPGDDVTRVVRRRVAPDLVLGVPCGRSPAPGAGRVAGAGRAHGAPALVCDVAGADRAGAEHRGAARRSGRGDRRRGQRRAGAAGERAETVAFDDFRHDPVALEWARGELAAGSWAEGYARLVKWADDPRRIGRQAGSALAAFERGEVAMVPWVGIAGRSLAHRRGIILVSEPKKPAEWVEGVALVRGGRNPALAQEFVRFLAGRGQAESPSPGDAGGKGEPDSGDDPERAALLADLLGATLVDAQDELWAAWAKLEAGGPSRAGRGAG